MDQILSPEEREARRARNALKVVPFRDFTPTKKLKPSSADNLILLRNQLVGRRFSIITAAAEANVTLSHSAIRQIAELQIAIAAIESVQDEDAPL